MGSMLKMASSLEGLRLITEIIFNVESICSIRRQCRLAGIVSLHLKIYPYLLRIKKEQQIPLKNWHLVV